MKLLLLSAVLLLSAMNRGCGDIEQGIAGKVIWLEGNLMPGIGDEPEVNRKRFKGQPVKRSIHIYKLTTMDEATAEGVFFRDIQTSLVTKVETNKEGEFAVSLPEGRYSIFTEEEEGLFANSFDGEGYINPVTVKKGEISTITIEINYKAAY